RWDLVPLVRDVQLALGARGHDRVHLVELRLELGRAVGGRIRRQQEILRLKEERRGTPERADDRAGREPVTLAHGGRGGGQREVAVVRRLQQDCLGYLEADRVPRRDILVRLAGPPWRTPVVEELLLQLIADLLLRCPGHTRRRVEERIQHVERRTGDR